MPRQYQMSWEGPPANRWVKMYRGARYRISCEELGAMVFTEQGSYKLANEWWKNKLAELTGRKESLLTEAEDVAEELAMNLAEAAILQNDVADTLLSPEVAERVTHRMESVARRLKNQTPRNPTTTLKHQADAFLGVVSTNQKPLTFRELKLFIRSLADMSFLPLDLSNWDNDTVEQMYLHLKGSELDNGTRHKRWGFFKRFVRHLWTKDVLPLPKLLDSKNLTFKIRAKKIKEHETAAVTSLLSSLSPRLRLYALLGLNCGMTSGDIGRLEKAQVDLGAGRLVRKRVKTGDYANVPTVDYLLWTQTIALLRQYWSDHDTLVLVSEDGTTLYENSIDGMDSPQKDLITQAWKRAKLPIQLRAMRSISASKLESHREYGRYKTHFLGHSPKSLADKNYAAPSGDLFDEIVTWLKGALGISDRPA